MSEVKAPPEKAPWSPFARSPVAETPKPEKLAEEMRKAADAVLAALADGRSDLT